MKLTVKPDSLKYVILGAGGLGLALRTLLYATGIDGRGLLEAGHWAQIALGLLTLAVVAAAVLLTRSIDGPTDHDTAYPVSFAAAMGAFAATVGIALTCIREFAEFSSTVYLLTWVLGLCSAVALGIVGVCRLTGAKPSPLLHGLVCVYFALRMISRYQLWSSDPQLLDYCFYLSAYVTLMLTAYHHAAFDADMGSHKALWLYSLASVYLGCTALKGSMDTALLLGCSAWAFTNLTCLTRRPRRQRPAMNFSEAPEAEE